MASWITPRASLSSLDRTAFRFVSIGLSVKILRRKQVSPTNRDCMHHFAVWRAGPLLELLSWVSIAQIFVSSRFYDKNHKDLFFRIRSNRSSKTATVDLTPKLPKLYEKFELSKRNPVLQTSATLSQKHLIINIRWIFQRYTKHT